MLAAICIYYVEAEVDASSVNDQVGRTRLYFSAMLMLQTKLKL